jgi:hypothetical protein
MLSRALQLILDGQFEQAGLERPRMYPGDRILVARRAYDATGFELGEDPRDLAEQLGLRIAPGHGRSCAGETAGDGTVRYVWSPDRRGRGLSVFHGLAHELLRIEGWEHTHADVWMLTGDLAIPSNRRLFDVDEVVRRAHVPEAFALRWITLAARFGRAAAFEEAA